MTIPDIALNLSGERLLVSYRLTGNERESRIKADDICIEQTVEFPSRLIKSGAIRDQIFGRVESFGPDGDAAFVAVISFAVEITGFELRQLLNVLFGNISLKPGIRIQQIAFPSEFLKSFRGPRFGVDGLRTLVGESTRPLLCTALKPMGLSAKQLARQAYQFALGGIDIIKDDHSLANQPFAPFSERVALCGEAVQKANRESGFKCLYFPSVSASPDELIPAATYARDSGAGGLLIAPGIIGLDAMRMLADNDELNLPIMSHPAFQGSLVTHSESGIAHGVIFGQLARLAGADASIFPNFGGRFSFSQTECTEIAANCLFPLGSLRPAFPTPGGGMNLARVPEIRSTYGDQVILLIGGALHQESEDLILSSRRFRRLVEAKE